MACAIPTPSSGDVPLPTSSISTNDLRVARPTRIHRHSWDGGVGYAPRIIAQIAISFANVLRLLSMSSSFESRESKESCVLHKGQCVYLTNWVILITNLKLAYPAGTKHPHIPMIVRSPTCRRYVLFPVYVCVRGRGEKSDRFSSW